ncbi:hypothetical protein [Hyphomicrobium sp.]|uniref:hypothetical protein n=1 Tax=Hyphomicrobium sp. TaxID=82 RepID=UPI0025B7B1F7|nr:hypothetical protein [Hyphomicrobium sp.]MCC7251093.1 hypothetical protein [Hyphomicrobium sp.]
MCWPAAGGILRRVMVSLSQLAQSATETVHALIRRWPLVLALLLAGGWIWFAVSLSDVQGRMDLPWAYSIRMTCEDDPEAALWHGGCERIEVDIAKTGRPGFLDLYNAFVTVHHAPGPREASAARFADAQADPAFDVRATLAGQRYGLASVLPEFEGVRTRAHAEAVKDAIDVRDRALLVIGRAGLGVDALIAGALANLVHPGAMVDGARQYAAILMGTAKKSDFATGVSERR